MLTKTYGRFKIIQSSLTRNMNCVWSFISHILKILYVSLFDVALVPSDNLSAHFGIPLPVSGLDLVN